MPGGQLFALPAGPSAYFKGPHKGISSTFSEQFAIQHGLAHPPNRRMRNGPKNFNGKNSRGPLRERRAEFQFGRQKRRKGNSCFGTSRTPGIGGHRESAEPSVTHRRGYTPKGKPNDYAKMCTTLILENTNQE